MNSTSITDYILKLEKRNEQLEKLLKKQSYVETTSRVLQKSVNQGLVDHLLELGEMTSDFHKTATYQKAADAISKIPHEIESGESLLKIPGIGKGIAAKVNEYLDEQDSDYEESESESESVASNEGQITDESSFFISYNHELADVFDKLASYEDDSHKRNAYRTAADVIYELPFEVTRGEELAKGPKKVKGIGKSIARTIDEFIATGKVKKLEKIGSTNEEIAWALEEYTDDLEDPFKIRAYKNAAEVIRNLDFEVTSGEELAKGPNKVRGIGKGIALKIDAFLQTGEIS
jgi:DNA polymerase/3'-5' exonuclease PolX